MCKGEACTSCDQPRIGVRRFSQMSIKFAAYCTDLMREAVGQAAAGLLGRRVAEEKPDRGRISCPLFDVCQVQLTVFV